MAASICRSRKGTSHMSSRVEVEARLRPLPPGASAPRVVAPLPPPLPPLLPRAAGQRGAPCEPIQDSSGSLRARSDLVDAGQADRQAGRLLLDPQQLLAR